MPAPKCPSSKAACAASRRKRGEGLARLAFFSSCSAEESKAMARSAWARCQRSSAATGMGSSKGRSAGAGGIFSRNRSEERRVGKEWRSGRSQYHEKKKEGKRE